MTTHIHPTAVIDPRAEIGEGTEIGPFCVIGAGVTLGAGCRLHGHVSITGPTRIGARNEFYPFAAIGGRSQDLKYAGEPTRLEIGDENVFREFVTVHRGDCGWRRDAGGQPGQFPRVQPYRARLHRGRRRDFFQ